MLIVVDDIHERISLCELTSAQFMHVCAILRLAMLHPNSHIAAVAARLYRDIYWILAIWPGRLNMVTVILAHLTWEEIFILQAYIQDCTAQIEGDTHLTAEILEALDAAVESTLRADGS